MPKVLDDDPWVERAARNYAQDAQYGLPYHIHMRGCGFSSEESTNRTLQMRVRRRSEQLQPIEPIQQQPPTLPPVAPVAPTDQQPAASTAINANVSQQDTADISGPSTKPKKTRKTAAAAQQERVNKRLRNEFKM